MHIDDELVRKFFGRECNEEEAKLVADWLKQHPHEAERYYKESDWINEPGAELPREGWDVMWNELSRSTSKKTPVLHWGSSIAAAVCLLLGSLWFFLPGKKPDHQLAARLPADSVIIRNDSDTSIDRTLSDGTIVKLLPHSVIRLSLPQWDTARQVQVEGEIVFHVAQDPKRPFIAYCNNLSVQALGTVFSVKEQRTAKQVNVRLYEGKVVVRPVRGKGEHRTRDFDSFLLPGQELTISPAYDAPQVTWFLQGQHKQVVVGKKRKGEMLTVQPTGWYEFTNQPLADVFTTLEVLYGVHIHYHKTTLEKLFFIGRFGPGDSIDYVLNTIALLNDLEITTGSDNHYYVAKKR
ncbi:DUF4974 domain-containing protein [Chitinophaga agrisoli]|uniref:DUF4974 domain-containing protein n=1 Tax=Chitinophaga agrisoli TaxID=2607653 RepID=A0A5B2VJS1_9BACT|nr:FecR family protein [Chitinophaga agrisoli]KAA2239843.1 DUF4974 domain-containing protein [Chitinophaga agrisoli]